MTEHSPSKISTQEKCYELNVSIPPKSECWSPQPSVWLNFWDGASKNVIKVKWGHKGGAWSERISVLKRRDTKDLAFSLPPCTHKE